MLAGGMDTLLLLGVVIFLICRARKTKARSSDAAPHVASSELRQQQNQYGVVGLAQAPAGVYEVGDVAPQPGGVQVRQTGVGTEYSAAL